MGNGKIGFLRKNHGRRDGKEDRHGLSKQKAEKMADIGGTGFRCDGHADNLSGRRGVYAQGAD